MEPPGDNVLGIVSVLGLVNNEGCDGQRFHYRVPPPPFTRTEQGTVRIMHSLAIYC